METVTLDHEDIEALARRVAELLERKGVTGDRRLLNAAELAKRFSIERTWVYRHAIELGALKLGDAPGARLRFDPEIASRVLRRLGEPPAQPTAPPPRSNPRSRRRLPRKVPLLPIRGRVAAGADLSSGGVDQKRS
jgi:hypothetical protein